MGGARAAGLFAVYMAVFLLDELVVFAAAVTAMRAAKLRERHGRVLKLVSGSLMLTLAGVLVVDPELMESVAGAGVVLAASVVVAAAVTARVGSGGRPQPNPDRGSPATGEDDDLPSADVR